MDLNKFRKKSTKKPNNQEVHSFWIAPNSYHSSNNPKTIFRINRAQLNNYLDHNLVRKSIYHPRTKPGVDLEFPQKSIIRHNHFILNQLSQTQLHSLISINYLRKHVKKHLKVFRHFIRALRNSLNTNKSVRFFPYLG